MLICIKTDNFRELTDKTNPAEKYIFRFTFNLPLTHTSITLLQTNVSQHTHRPPAAAILDL